VARRDDGPELFVQADTDIDGFLTPGELDAGLRTGTAEQLAEA